MQADSSKDTGISLLQVFLLEAQFSHAPDALQHAPGTPVNVQVQITAEAAISEDRTQALVTLRAKTADDEAGLYRYNIAVSGIFAFESQTSVAIDEFMRKNAPALLTPFLRENLANISSRGRFGPLWLPMLNFAGGQDLPKPVNNSQPAK